VLELVEKVCHRVVVIHKGKVVADDTVGSLRTLMATSSLEEVFSQLVLRDDPARTAMEIADVVACHA
jgi:ABC-2 type transport system ATP-binding protein